MKAALPSLLTEATFLGFGDGVFEIPMKAHYLYPTIYFPSPTESTEAASRKA
jgi:hypothetical protein